MRVKINRDVCTAQLAFCERCLGKMLREPMGYERHCFEEIIEDDDSELLTLEITSGGNHTVVTLDEEQRLVAAAEGWSYFVDFIPDMYRTDKADRETIQPD